MPAGSTLAALAARYIRWESHPSTPDYPLFQGKPYQTATGAAEAKDFAEKILDELGPADAA